MHDNPLAHAAVMYPAFYAAVWPLARDDSATPAGGKAWRHCANLTSRSQPAIFSDEIR
jgi:hypothetical protein